MKLGPDTTFLVVDDISTICATVQGHLKDLGFNASIFLANSVSEAKTILEKEKVDFIISDWHMPFESGIDLLRHVRKTPQYKKTPFLMLTTENESPHILEAIESGASNYLVKPWKAQDLLYKIKMSWQKEYDVL